MTYSLNERQAKAVAFFGSDLVVTAGAGTGKTSVLTSKYLRLLEERRAGVNEIVAITFTNKAAAEMRNRIQQLIQGHLTGAEQGEAAEYWQDQLLKLEGARISTFHSFCLGLLREQPLEAGIPPISGVLSDGEEAVYLNQAITTVLTGEFSVKDEHWPILMRLLQDYGWEKLSGDLAHLYCTIRESGLDFSATFRIAANRPNCSKGYSMNSLIQEITEFLEYSRSQKLTERGEEVIASFEEKWPDYQEVLNGENSFETVIPALTEIRKALPGNLPKVLKERLTAIHDMLAGICQQVLDRECLKRLPVIERLLGEIDREYTAIKLEEGLVDFTDQQLLAKNLLTDYPDLAAKVRQGIKYILVDEFQDTNGLQMNLIGGLTGYGYQGGRLMVVGDIKQSIYRFRGAEAQLINDLSSQIRDRGGEVIALAENYRSDQVVIDFVNLISNRIFEGETFEYEPLQGTKSSSGAGIEFLLTGAEDRVREAQMIAARIGQLVREGQSENGPVNYGDIVLLFRAGTGSLLYQQALQDMGIPYYNSCGGDFYHRQEITDQLNLLRLVEQRYDSVALLALLNSPYVGLSEIGLFWLGRNGDLVKEFYESTKFATEIPVAERRRLLDFRELLNYLFQNREILQISGILRTALERSHYQQMLWASPNGSQQVANVEKLLAKADEFMAKGFQDLKRFLSYIAELEGMGILESEAPTEAEMGNVVRLITIHRAKGLEFPVVIIPELDRPFNFRKQGNLIFHKQVGLGMTIPLEDAAIAEPSMVEAIKGINRREEISELKRLLYVAMTRAKSRLIMAGSGDSGFRGDTLDTANSWMKWFEFLLPLNEAGEAFEFEGVPVRVIRSLPEAAPPLRSQTVLDGILPKLEPGAARRKPSLEVAVTVEPKTELFRVSEILTYLNCPRRYFWQYRMGLTAISYGTEADDVSGFGDNQGALIGDFIHRAAARVTDSWPEELWKEMFGGQSDSGRVKDDLLQIWRNFRNSPYTEKAGRLWDEVSFLLKLTPEIRVEGRFDRLLQSEAGEMILVDYKTHRVAAERVNAIAGSYFPQLQLYALAIKALWGKLPNRAVLYFPYSDQGVAVPLDQVSLEKLVAEVGRMAEFIGNHHRPEDYPNSGKCEKCSYRWVCG
ncbi:MAG: UvrD-helicase domain-containing protein [Firmicutes bacterium]|nr:UvrD-helicase domain-containing protein [Bacillota bacterium]